MRKRLSGLLQRAGRRGLFLMFLAILDACYGYSLLLTRPLAGAFYPAVSQREWALIWILGAVVCATGIFARRDRWQFSFAAAVKAGWAAQFIYLWYRHVPLAWAGVTVWLAFAGTILVISGWPEVQEIDELPVIPLTPPGSKEGP